MTTYANWSNISTAQDWLMVANTNSGGVFWQGILFTFVIIAFLSMFVTVGVEGALMASLFLGIMAGTFMLYMGIITSGTLGILVGAEVILIIYAVFSSYKSNVG